VPIPSPQTKERPPCPRPRPSSRSTICLGFPGPGTLTWLPVRHTLGIRAFGADAYVAAAAALEHLRGPAAEDEDLASLGQNPRFRALLAGR
jgi:hypothetical protein